MFQNCSEGQTNAPKHFSETFRKFPKMSEDSQRLPKTFEKTRRCFDDTPTNLSTILRDKLDISEIIDIFTCEEIISSHVTISCRFYRSVTTRYTTDFYIVKMFICQISKSCLCLVMFTWTRQFSLTVPLSTWEQNC